MMTLKEIEGEIEELKALIRNADEATKKEIEYRLDDLMRIYGTEAYIQKHWRDLHGRNKRKD